MRFATTKMSAKSTTKTEAVLIKKHHSIAYHPDRKTVATNKSCVQVRDLHDSVGPICRRQGGQR
jgi:hypothetical protein